MLPWGPQTDQCILCALRTRSWFFSRPNGKRIVRNVTQYSRIRVAEGLKLQRNGRWTGTSSNLFSRPRLGRGQNIRFLDQQGNDTVPSWITRGWYKIRKDHPKTQAKNAILNELRDLKRRLEASRSSEDPEIKKYSVADPEDIYWESFEQKIKSYYQDEVEKGTAREENELASKVLEIEAKHRRHGFLAMQRALYYQFLDHAIACHAADNSPTLKKFADLRYPTEWYPEARAMQREIHLHVGPTNSGKTYTALKRLEEAASGFYAGPLRLLAYEVYTRFQAKGIPCDLITGDDIRRDESGRVRLFSSTVEMVDTGRLNDVAIIDEIQMIAHEERGWAWTRAFLGARAKEVHLCGELRVIPLIRELAASMGDLLHIHKYERLNPLKAMSRSFRGNLKNLRKGDCVVVFSVLGIHAMKRQIELDTGRRVAIVYGSLPPDTRAKQAALFNDPNNDYDFLVASDAIGMGLNLSIKRIVFESTWKFDGKTKHKMSISEIKQVAGRAGRYRTADQATQKITALDSADPQDIAAIRANEYQATANIGLVTCLEENDLPDIQEALAEEAPPIKAAGVLPPAQFIDEYAAQLPKGLPFDYILHRLLNVSAINPRYFHCNLKDQVGIAQRIESIRNLSIFDRCQLVAAPADYRSREGEVVLKALAAYVAEQKSVDIADIKEIPLQVLDEPLTDDREYLYRLETLHKALILFLWLSYRFTNVFVDREMAFHAKELVEEKINRALVEFSANPKIRARLLAIGRMHAPIPPRAENAISAQRDSVSDTTDLQKTLSQHSAIDVVEPQEQGDIRLFSAHG